MENRTLLQDLRRTPKLSTPVLVISKMIVIAIPIAEVVIGSLYLKSCPVQKFIPIYLVVMGAFTLSLTLLSCLPCTQEPEDGSQTALSSVCTAWNSIVSLFLFCWFIAGNVWIYSKYQPNYVNPDASDYCHKTLYLFAFWVTSLVYILIGGFFVLGCCAMICLAICGKVRGFGYNRHEDI
ncbi:transmembrane protein 272-like [Engraulis encrasicolus]|uniref:transmembrane protein 272-like n=1 Tax=Engraulis encrasicolus TaxID=184585 RepID=UPI002FD0818C